MNSPVTEAQKAFLGRHLLDLIPVVHLVHAGLIVEDHEALNLAVREGFIVVEDGKKLTSLGYLMYLLTEPPEGVANLRYVAQIEERHGTEAADRAYSKIFGRPAPQNCS